MYENGNDFVNQLMLFHYNVMQSMYSISRVLILEFVKNRKTLWNNWFLAKKIKSGTTFKYPKFIEKPKKSDAICMISK